MAEAEAKKTRSGNRRGRFVERREDGRSVYVISPASVATTSRRIHLSPADKSMISDILEEVLQSLDGTMEKVPAKRPMGAKQSLLRKSATKKSAKNQKAVSIRKSVSKKTTRKS